MKIKGVGEQNNQSQITEGTRGSHPRVHDLQHSRQALSWIENLGHSNLYGQIGFFSKVLLAREKKTLTRLGFIPMPFQFQGWYSTTKLHIRYISVTITIEIKAVLIFELPLSNQFICWCAIQFFDIWACSVTDVVVSYISNKIFLQGWVVTVHQTIQYWQNYLSDTFIFLMYSNIIHKCSTACDVLEPYEIVACLHFKCIS